jgi:transcriptional regulator with XRE-family HTH domain
MEVANMAKLRIKEVAEAKGIKQSHLQIEAKVTPPLLNRYWNNKSNTVDLTELEKIAEALGVKPGELIISDKEFAQTEEVENVA